MLLAEAVQISSAIGIDLNASGVESPGSVAGPLGYPMAMDLGPPVLAVERLEDDIIQSSLLGFQGKGLRGTGEGNSLPDKDANPIEMGGHDYLSTGELGLSVFDRMLGGR